MDDLKLYYILYSVDDYNYHEPLYQDNDQAAIEFAKKLAKSNNIDYLNMRIIKENTDGSLCYVH